jgi:hypothetical protein
MAGGTSNKSNALIGVALAKLDAARKALEHLNGNGVPAGDPRHAAVADPAITAAITALQALV